VSIGDDDLPGPPAELLSGLDPGEVAELLKSMTDIRVVLSVDIVGMDEIDAYALAKSEASRL
jgi:hypothetical protein